MRQYLQRAAVGPQNRVETSPVTHDIFEGCQIPLFRDSPSIVYEENILMIINPIRFEGWKHTWVDFGSMEVVLGLRKWPMSKNAPTSASLRNAA